mgnify:CR=1 FL=1
MISLDLKEYNRTQHENTVVDIARRLSDSNVPYCFIKSSSLALQGLPVNPNDIDILTTAEGAYNLQRALQPQGNLVREVQYSTDGMFGSYFGRLNIDGIPVEIIGEFTEKHSKGWKSNKKVLEERVFVYKNGCLIPVSSLQDERESYEELKREKDAVKRKVLNEIFSLKI